MEVRASANMISELHLKNAELLLENGNNEAIKGDFQSPIEKASDRINDLEQQPEAMTNQMASAEGKFAQTTTNFKESNDQEMQKNSALIASFKSEADADLGQLKLHLQQEKEVASLL